jgi:hypothetical protein
LFAAAALLLLLVLLLLLQFSHYWWPSVFGIIPSLIIYIYLGSLAADVSSAISGGGAHAAPPAGEFHYEVFCSVSPVCTSTHHASLSLGVAHMQRLLQMSTHSIGFGSRCALPLIAHGVANY